MLAHVGDVPGFGWRGWTPADATGVEPVTVTGAATAGRCWPTASSPWRWTPPTAPSPSTATPGCGRLVDGGDCGDTYNWCPPTDDTVVDSPASVDVAVLERGPLRARVLVVARYRWPAGREGLDRRTAATVDNTVHTRLELRAGERAVRVEVTVDNASRDHRLRAHFPLPSPADELAGGVRVRDRRAGARGRGRADRGPARHLPGPAVRAGRGPHGRPRRRHRVRARRRPHSWRSRCCGPPACSRRCRWPPGPSRPGRWSPRATPSCRAGHPALRRGGRRRRPVRPGRRGPGAAARGRARGRGPGHHRRGGGAGQRPRPPARRVRPRRHGRRGVGRDPRGRRPGRPGVQPRRRARDRRASPGAGGGWSTCGAARCSPSRAPSTCVPAGSPPRSWSTADRQARERRPRRPPPSPSDACRSTQSGTRPTSLR